MALAAAWVIAVAAVALWVSGTAPPILREQLKSAQFYSLELCAVVAIVGGAVLARDLWRSLDRRDIVAMTGLAALALALTLLLAPRTHRIFYDEQIYQGIGQNLSDLRRAQMCNDGIVEYGRLRCFATEYNKQPYAYPHVLSLVYRVVGVRPGVAFAVNAVAMAATACGVYLLAWLLFGDRVVAGFAGLLITLTPHQLLWSATAAVEPTASLACVLALVAVLQAWRSGSVAALAGAVAMTAYAVQFRPESLLILRGPGGARVASSRRDRRLASRLDEPAGIRAAGRARGAPVRRAQRGLGHQRVAPLAAVPVAQPPRERPVLLRRRALSVHLHGPGADRAGGARLARRALRAGRLLVGVLRHRLAVLRRQLQLRRGRALLAADLSTDSSARRPRRRQARHMAGAAGCRRGGNGRPSPPGCCSSSSGTPRWCGRRRKKPGRPGPMCASRGPSRPGCRAASYVLTHNPAMFHVWGINAGQMSLATVNPLQIDYLGMRYPGGVFVHWNYWCNAADPTQQKYCHTALGSVAIHGVARIP